MQELEFASNPNALRTLEQTLGIPSSDSALENEQIRLQDTTGRGSPGAANGREDLVSDEGIYKRLEEMLRSETELNVIKEWIDVSLLNNPLEFVM